MGMFGDRSRKVVSNQNDLQAMELDLFRMQMQKIAREDAQKLAIVREALGITESLRTPQQVVENIQRAQGRGDTTRMVDVTDTPQGQLSNPEPLFEMARQIRQPEIQVDELPLISIGDATVVESQPTPEMPLPTATAPTVETQTETPASEPSRPTTSNFTQTFVNEMAVLEGLGGDTVLGDKEPTYSYGITKRKADEFGMSPDQFGSMKEFATEFSQRYIEEKENTYSDIFDGTLSEDTKLGLHSYLFNAGKFYPAQLRALANNDISGFIDEMKDVINTEGMSMTGLSKRRAAEANILGKDIEGWVPIATVRASGTRENPVYEWLSEEGDVLYSFSDTKPMHPKSKLGEVDV